MISTCLVGIYPGDVIKGIGDGGWYDWAWLGAVGLCLALCEPAAAQQTGARASSFAYDPTSGLLTREVVEPDLAQFRLQTDYTIDAFGNRTGVTVSGGDIATRSSTTTFDTRGQFPLSSTNALNQSESWGLGRALRPAGEPYWSERSDHHLAI